MFEYLLEHGAMVNGVAGDCIADTSHYHHVKRILEYREAWMMQAIHLIHRWHLPMTAIRTIHEYNWHDAYAGLCDGLN